MNILILTGSVPYPLASGGAIRVNGIINGLNKAGHNVTLLSFHDAERGINPSETPLAPLCRRIETVPLPTRSRVDRLRDLLLSRQPDVIGRMDSDAIRDKLEQLLSNTQFDLVQFEGFETTGYMEFVKELQPDAALCYDSFNAEYVLQRTIAGIDLHEVRRWTAAAYSMTQSRRIAHFERKICHLADFVNAVSPEDRDALHRLSPETQIFVIPSGIFVDHYVEPDGVVDLQPNALVFTGKMDYRPNVDAMLWFVERILPAVLKRIPDAHLYIVGQKPHPRLGSLHQRPGISLTGWVDLVQPYLNNADVYIAPLRMGSGTRLKMLEAMASGCAIVATQTAAAGLTHAVSDAVIIQNDRDADGFAEAIVNLLENPSERETLKDNARHYVRSHYDWSVIMPRLLAAYEEVGLG